MTSPLLVNIHSQGCILSPILYTLFTYDCVASHKDSTILKIVDDITMIGCITGGDEVAYRREVASLVSWCEDNNFAFNTEKTKEMIVDMTKKKSKEISSATVHLGAWSREELQIPGRPHQWWPNLVIQHHAAGKEGLTAAVFSEEDEEVAPEILSSFYGCIIKSILTGCIPIWYSSTSAFDLKRLQSVVKTAKKITRPPLPSLQSIYHRRVHRSAASILKDPTHPQHGLLWAGGTEV